jgi:predicted lipid-binding transport protein (Tim44 family)
MGDGVQFLDIIIFAAIAVFLGLRLRGVLGRRTGNERQQRDPFKRPVPESRDETDRDKTGRDKVIPLPDRNRTPTAEPAPADIAKPEAGGLPGLAQIRAADPSFDPQGFLGGARAAFEMIVGAFAAGDAAALKPLLSDEVFENFNGAIKARAKAKETLETTLVGISSAEIVEAELQGRSALVTVKFVSEQINVTKDAEGRIVDGDPATVAAITDIWTFARNTRARDPNWTLVATRSPN